MREIKFRGMLESGEWIYGGYVKVKDGAHCILSGECNHYRAGGKTKNILSFNAVKFKTVGEYTGLKDKNGKEIYEGDIAIDSMKCLHEIVFAGGCWIAKREHGGDMLCSTNDFVEVIGNIYENPELLKEIKL